MLQTVKNTTELELKTEIFYLKQALDLKKRQFSTISVEKHLAKQKQLRLMLALTFSMAINIALSLYLLTPGA